MSDYVVSIRGLVPPDLARKVSQAHAFAVQQRLTSAVIAPVGKGRTPDATRQPR